MTEDFNPKCHIGEIHGIYTIVDMTGEKDKYGHWIYKCVCNECGCIRLCKYAHVASPSQVVTKCHHRKSITKTFVHYYPWENKRLKNIYKGMLDRCYNDNDKSYKWYGGNGIRVCQEWIDNPGLFEEWSLSNGYSDNLTIDRINENEDYCPRNCQWISFEENSRKAGNVNWITVANETLTGKQWSEKLQLGVNTINNAIKKYGIEKTKELIAEMLISSPTAKERKPNQSWFDVYGIQV